MRKTRIVAVVCTALMAAAVIGCGSTAQTSQTAHKATRSPSALP